MVFVCNAEIIGAIGGRELGVGLIFKLLVGLILLLV